jgi:hypothetical protein
MLYKKIAVELVVHADEAEAVVKRLNGALDHLEQNHTIFGGDIEAVSFTYRANRGNRRSLIRWLQKGPSLLLLGIPAST